MLINRRIRHTISIHSFSDKIFLFESPKDLRMFQASGNLRFRQHAVPSVPRFPNLTMRQQCRPFPFERSFLKVQVAGRTATAQRLELESVPGAGRSFSPPSPDGSSALTQAISTFYLEHRKLALIAEMQFQKPNIFFAGCTLRYARAKHCCQWRPFRPGWKKSVL
jgi:hypothetical protein